MPDRFRVLLVEDVEVDAELVAREMKRAGLRFDKQVVDTEPEFRYSVTQFQPDIILSDFSMPHFDGMSALSIARQVCPDTPFIFVSGTLGEEYAIRALKNGATDYVLKTNLVRLPAAIERALLEVRARKERERVEQELRQTEERLSNILREIEDVLWSANLGNHMPLFISAAHEVLSGYTIEEFLNSPDLWHRLIHPDDLDLVMRAFDALPQSGGYDIEYRIIRKGGAVRWLHDRCRVIREDGQPPRVDGVARDITERMLARQRISRLSRIRDLTSAINATLVRVRETDLLFKEVCRVAIDIGKLRAAQVWVVDQATNVQRCVCAEGSGAEETVGMSFSLDAARQPGHVGPGGRVIHQKIPIVSNDLLNDNHIHDREKLIGRGTRAIACFPMLVEDQAVGVFSLQADETGFFDDEEVKLLLELTANISFALDLIEKRQKINYLAFYDPLTGLPNRTLFLDRVHQALVAAKKNGELLAVLLFDLEGFKAINDAYGHHIGDRLLIDQAARARAAMGGSDRLARVGADVFAVFVQTAASEAELMHNLTRGVENHVGQLVRIDDLEIRVSARFGVALFPADGSEAQELFQNAEAALKRAKSTRESLVFYAPAFNARVAERLALENSLRQAVEERQFVLFYQPKVDAKTRRIVDVEALLRWNHPVEGIIPPSGFLGSLEDSGLIIEVGQWVIAQAAATWRTWRQRMPNPPRIAVNVSAKQLRQPDFVEMVRQALDFDNVGEHGIDLEVTESLLMDDLESSMRKLSATREFGVNLALDDFGTGYSSLSYLSQLPFDALKIDRSFVSKLTDNPDDTTIVATIITMAQAMRKIVIAEGVETEQQAQLLSLLRCDQMQGYLFSAPLPQQRIEDLLFGN